MLQGKRSDRKYHSVSGSFKLVRTSCSLRSTIKILLMYMSSSTLKESCEGPNYKFTFKICKYCCCHLAEKLRLGIEVLRAKKERVISEWATLHFWVLSFTYLKIVHLWKYKSHLLYLLSQYQVCIHCCHCFCLFSWMWIFEAHRTNHSCHRKLSQGHLKM